MKEQTMRRIVTVLLLVVTLVGGQGIGPARLDTHAQEATPAVATETLTEEELQGIIDAAVAAAEQTPSLLRVDAQGGPLTTRMHIAIVDRNGHLLALHSMEDAWPVSIDIALAKAYTAAAISSNQNAVSSRSLGLLTQPGVPSGTSATATIPAPGTTRSRSAG